MDMPLTLTAEEAVLLDHLFRHGPRQTEGNPAAVGLVEKGLARWADASGTIEITEEGRGPSGIYRID